ncbi:MAG: TonB-dependent receptor [Sphingomonadales bacterium]
MRNRNSYLFLSFIFGALGLSGPVVAQMAETDDEAGVIEEIVVTSQRREERLQDVPITVSAFDYDDIENLNADDAFDLANITPGLQIKSSYYGRAPVIYMRGVGINDVNQNFQAPIAVYFDEVFMASTVGQVSQMFDLERIEVLKGPQGTLFGRNTTGGLMSFVARKPTGELEGNAELSLGELNLFNLDAAFSFPIVFDKLSARIAVSRKSRDGFQFNVFDGRDDGEIDKVDGRAILRYQPDETFDSNLILSFGRGRSAESQKKPQGLFEFDAMGNATFCANPTLGGPNACADVLGFVDTNGPRTIVSNVDAFQDIDTFGATLSFSKTGLDLVGQDFGLKSITAYMDAEHVGLEDVNTDPNDVLNINWYSDFYQFSQEVQLFSTGGGPLEWIVGGHFQHEDLMVANVFEFFFLIDAFGGLDGDPSTPGDGAHLMQAYKQKVTSWAGFLDATYNITDEFAITGGLRITNEQRKFDRSSLAVPEVGLTIEQKRDAFNDESLAIFPFIERALERIEQTELTWRVVVNYQPQDDVMFYSSASKGFKSGGFSGGGLFEASEFTPFDPEMLFAYEGGVKSTWVDRRLRFNVSAFVYDYQDLQVFAFFRNPETNTIGNFTDNASDAEIFGVDMDITAVPMRGVVVQYGMSWLPTARFQNFLTLDPAGDPIDLSGNRLQSSPRLNFNFAIEVGREVGGGGYAFVRLDGYHNSKMFFENENRDRVSSKEAYTVLNLRANYEYENRWTLSFWVKNLTDKLVLEDVLPLEVLGIDQITVNDPQTWGVSLGATF